MSLIPGILGGLLSAVAPLAGSPQAATTDDPVHAKLRQAADGLNGMFIRQLFSAMRATVPSDADGLGSAGNTMFTQMLDDTVADRAATQMRHGLGDAIYRELCARLTSAGGSGQ
jgi:Rod binding domain-containing protein